MRPRHVLILVGLSALGVLAAVNHVAMSIPVHLNLLFGKIEAPLGVVLLAVVGFLVLLYQLLLFRTEAVRLLEGRRASKAVEEARRLADSAEASRVESLRRLVEEGFDHFDRRLDELARSRAARRDPPEDTGHGVVEKERATIAR